MSNHDKEREQFYNDLSRERFYKDLSRDYLPSKIENHNEETSEEKFENEIRELWKASALTMLSTGIYETTESKGHTSVAASVADKMVSHFKKRFNKRGSK